VEVEAVMMLWGMFVVRGLALRWRERERWGKVEYLRYGLHGKLKKHRDCRVPGCMC
jgi:hypothetical protein